MTAPTRARAVAPRHAARPRPAEEPRRPHLELVPKGRRPARARRPRLVALASTLLVCLGLFGVVTFHVVLGEGQLQLDRLQQQAAQEQARYDRLRLQVAELEAPERIVAVAQQRIGMVPAPGVTYLSPSGVTTGGDPRQVARRRDAGPATSWPVVKANLAGRP